MQKTDELNIVLPIRIKNKIFKKEIKKFILYNVHLKNLVYLLQYGYLNKFKKFILNESVFYALTSDKKYKPRNDNKNAEKYLKEYSNVKNNINSDRELLEFLIKIKQQKQKINNSAVSQLTIKQAINDIKNTIKAKIKYKQNSTKFNGRPNLPKPKKLNEVYAYTIQLNKNSFKVDNEFLIIKLCKWDESQKIKLPDFVMDKEIKSIRLKMIGEDIWADVVYKIDLEKFKKVDGNYKAGLDLGINNLISIFSNNPELKSVIINGKEIKSINQWFNKEFSKLQSKIDRYKTLYKATKDKYYIKYAKKLKKRFKQFLSYRKRYMNDVLHKISRFVVNLLYRTGHNIIYIGKNITELKNGINLGCKNNQIIYSIPFKKLINFIKYKAELLGMRTILVNESYTSSVSPFAEKVHRLNQKTGNRIKRGLFLDKIKNKIFNADLVGALNILKKGAMLPEINLNEKLMFIKLCNPIKVKLKDLFKVIPESLIIEDRG